ncbi:MAG: T9SS type A sorting domain-containing protein [Bacteroidetes bacterium]|nr:T9SS type A sorting domain-containing protein [Bacteroidota bacterium]MBU1679860.1 T9SS type A sorting domain-containing protein [Bacteroidota bacterium]
MFNHFMKFRISLSLVTFFVAVIIQGQFTNVQLNLPAYIDPEEVSIAINPKDANQLAGGANLNYFYSSKDGGSVWSQMRMSSTLGVWGDPCVVYDTEGNLYFAHLSNPQQGYWIDRIVVQKSSDNGITWNNGSGIGFNYPKEQDKEWLAVDHSGSQYRNNIYMSWTEFDNYGTSNPSDSSRILFSRSTDAGDIWSAPVRLSDHGGNCIDSDETVEGAVPAVGPSGEVYVAWAGPKGIMFDKSLDGGVTFGKDIFVDPMPTGWDMDVPGINRCNGMPITACDISRSQYRGNVYVLWADQRNGSSNTDIFFKKSIDGGESWSDVKKVNDDVSERHQFFPWMAVDSTNGNIYAVFYDRRNTSGVETDVYLARSIDGGETFSNHKISNSSFIPDASIFFGDYTNIAAYMGIIRPIWMRMDNRILSVLTALINDKDLVVSVKEGKYIPAAFELKQNYPNPFNPSTTISFSLPANSFVTLEVFNAIGEKIQTLFEGNKNAGVHEVNFNPENLSSGVYYYKLTTGNFVEFNKMVLAK